MPYPAGLAADLSGGARNADPEADPHRDPQRPVLKPAAASGGANAKRALPRRTGLFLCVAQKAPRGAGLLVYSAQFSSSSSGTRANSPVLLVTRVRPSARAWAAISISSGPIGVPFFCRKARTAPYSDAAAGPKGKTLSGARKRSSACPLRMGSELFCTPNSSSARVTDEMHRPPPKIGRAHV